MRGKIVCSSRRRTHRPVGLVCLVGPNECGRMGCPESRRPAEVANAHSAQRSPRLHVIRHSSDCTIAARSPLAARGVLSSAVLRSLQRHNRNRGHRSIQQPTAQCAAAFQPRLTSSPPRTTAHWQQLHCIDAQMQGAGSQGCGSGRSLPWSLVHEAQARDLTRRCVAEICLAHGPCSSNSVFSWSRAPFLRDRPSPSNRLGRRRSSAFRSRIVSGPLSPMHPSLSPLSCMCIGV